jgi:chemotaxis protein MotB
MSIDRGIVLVGNRSACRALGAGVLVAALGLSAMLGGCASKRANGPSALELENQELRARLAQIDAALAEAQGRAGTLEGEVDRLEAERAALQRQLSEASRPAAAPVRQQQQTGFEGIEGISVSGRGGELVVDIAADVLFASGSATLRQDAKAKLDQVASVLNARYSANEIRIAGHSDSDPIRRSNWKTNERLSAERALVVEEYLVSRGVSNNRMHIAAYGPAKPKATKAASRRVEIIILQQN